MGMRETFMDMVAGMLAFGRVTETKQATNTKQVLASIAGNGGGTATAEARPFQALWGHAAILFRPPADTEVIFARIGDEMVPVASRDIRFSITVEEGEVVVRNLKSDKPVRVRLLASGEVLIEATKIAGVDPGEALAIATKALALAEKVDSNFTSVRTILNAHVHSGVTVGSGSTGALVTPLASLPGTAGARFFSKD